MQNRRKIKTVACAAKNTDAETYLQFFKTIVWVVPKNTAVKVNFADGEKTIVRSITLLSGDGIREVKFKERIKFA